MTEELLSHYTPYIETITLQPSSGGRFEVSVNGNLIFSKKATGKHAQPGEVAALLEERFGFTKTPLE